MSPTVGHLVVEIVFNERKKPLLRRMHKLYRPLYSLIYTVSMKIEPFLEFYAQRKDHLH